STYFLDLPTSEFDFSQRAKSSFPGLSDETINNFILFNKNKHIINDTLFTSNSNYSVELKNNIVWNEIYNKYPDRIGVVFFSKVGFNNDKTQAFVDIGFLKAKKSGYGFQVLFKKKGSKWAVLMWLNKWMS
ncbi:MAG: hypothetical protein K8R79_10070, partial [Calditrichales bacterium]|nr:hypothetical protein [Calditrichales bacterium]